MINILKENKEFELILKMIAPGAPLRQALNKIQEASLGALIVLSDLESIEKYLDGGFVLNTNFASQKVYELAKMDGAVVLSEDLKMIYGANVQLQTGKNIDTLESGTRHRTADRIAKLTNKIVITISERRKNITIFKGNFKYELDSINDLLIKSSQAIMSLERYVSKVEKNMLELNESELSNEVYLEDLLMYIKDFYLMSIMDVEVTHYILQLGEEGRLVELQYHEIMNNQKNNLFNFIKDYSINQIKSIDKLYEEFILIEKDEITEERLAKLLGYDLKQNMLDDIITSKGYRILSMINKLNKKDVENLISHFGNLINIFNASYEELASIKGMGSLKIDRINNFKTKLLQSYNY